MIALQDIKLPPGYNYALSSGHESIDSLMGIAGGIFGLRLGKVICLSAQTGTGKTRLCMQLLSNLHKHNDDFRSCIFSGEQGRYVLKDIQEQMKLEIGPDQYVEAEYQWTEIVKQTLEMMCNVIVIDSFPMLEFPLKPNGKMMNTKEMCKAITDFATQYNVCIILINHTDKAGKRGGKNTLFHLVDVAYTMAKNVRDDIKVVDFRCDKNREGTPINLAIGFNGIWEFDYAISLEGDINSDGADNNSRIATKKAELRHELLQRIKDSESGLLLREDLETGQFNISGFPTSTIYSTLRILVKEGFLKTTYQHTATRGRNPIATWELTEIGMNEVE